MKTDTEPKASEAGHSLDAFTRRHLHAWMESGHAPCDFGYNDERESAILRWLDAQDAIDREHALNNGWPYVYYRAIEA